MEIYENILGYFLNNKTDLNTYSDLFYIRALGKDLIEGFHPDKEFFVPHKRGFFEIAVLIRNNKTIQIGDQVTTAFKHGLTVISPYQTIDYVFKDKPKPNNDDDEGYIIYFKTSLFERFSQSYELQNEFPFFKIHTLPLYALSDAEFESLIPIADEMYKESRSNGLNGVEIIRSLLNLLLYKIKRMTQNIDSVVTVNRFEAIMARFEHVILSKKNGFLSVKEYASLMNISAIYLTECVKKASGKSAQKIIIDYKILHARGLLLQEQRTIAEISDMLGFNEVANFNQFFKRNTGMTASQFRKEK